MLDKLSVGWAIVLAVGAGGGCLDIFPFNSRLFSL